MNYIKQLNAFYELLAINPLSSSAVCLYGVLLHVNNKCNWITEFKVANLTLQSFTGLSRIALDRARNELVQKNYIKYKKGSGNQSGKYTIINLIVRFDTQTDTQSDTEYDTQCDTQSENINKHKLKHKHNIFNELKIYSNFSENVECECISKSTNQKCCRKSSYSINGKNYCNQHSRAILENVLKEKQAKFVKPTIEEIKKYCIERKNNIDPEQFYDFYETKGWKVGNNAMKDWKACIRTWEKRSFNNLNEKIKTSNNKVTYQGYSQREYTDEELEEFYDRKGLE